MHDAAVKVSRVFFPFTEHFSLFAFQFSSSTTDHHLLITSLLIHPRSAIRRLLHGKHLPSILFYPPPTSPQLPRFSHTGTLSPTAPASTPTRSIHLLFGARLFHVWAEIRRFVLSKDELDGVELFGVALWDGYFDLDLEGVYVADPTAESARKEGADASWGQKFEC